MNIWISQNYWIKTYYWLSFKSSLKKNIYIYIIIILILIMEKKKKRWILFWMYTFEYPEEHFVQVDESPLHSVHCESKLEQS